MPTPPPSPPQPPHSRLRSCLIGCGAILLITGLLIAGGGWYAWRLWNSPPLQWTAARQSVATLTPEERKTRAVAFEERITREFSFTPESLTAIQTTAPVPGSSSPSEAKTIAIDPVDANAWLEERLPQWAANQGLPLPPDLTGVTVWLEDDRPVVAGQYRDQVFSASLDFQLQPDGKAVARPMQVRGGQVQLPVETLVEEGAKELQTRGHGDKAGVLRGEPFDPVVPIDDGRQARLVGFDTEGGTFNLHLRAEPRP